MSVFTASGRGWGWAARTAAVRVIMFNEALAMFYKKHTKPH